MQVSVLGDPFNFKSPLEGFLPKHWIKEYWVRGFYITAVAGSTGGCSLVVMSKGTPYTNQAYQVHMQPSVIFAQRIMRFFSLVPLEERGMSTLPMTLQVAESVPIKWINTKWTEGYYITSMAYFQGKWVFIMSKNASFVDQHVELDFQHPSEGYLKWATGGTVPALACTLFQLCMNWRVLASDLGWQCLRERHTGLSACASYIHLTW